ncbi:hypothetical protein BDV98DRAFT_599302 [Pterulicium gracile]|uniref:NADPH:adrenodoxin oxidoreductase, mitochondrial n=1 Tax=Pterulicium gracile TaxID=1884261 RepID=A0A5C3R2Q2_9AGAR|nr:hypothetical protein BDV98DRAFT_599302 [Pterula gracilis]
MKLAVIGAGPSAFYTASRVLSRLPEAASGIPPLRVHMYDRLWAPHGLVRYGVAPDHPEVKNCTNKFDESALDRRFRFFGNVNVGTAISEPFAHTLQLPLSTIAANYTHVLFATGCALPNLHSALPPSPYSIPALSFVHWYTQHPSRPDPPPLHRLRHVTIIGNGNVALDVARMLLTPVSELAKYDVPQDVLDVLATSAVEHVSIVARRGPLEAAFTTKELRELTNLTDAYMVPVPQELLAVPEDVKLTRQQTRMLDLLKKGSKNKPGTVPKSWSLEFYRSPVGITPSPADTNLATLSLAHTAVDPGTKRSVETGETSSVATSLVIPSLGSIGEPTAPYYDPALQHLRTNAGRIVSSTGHTVKNAYASGWAAMGARGVLATTMINAFAVAETIITDVMNKREEPEEGVEEALMNHDADLEQIPAEVEQGVRSGLVTQYDDWKKADAEEISKAQSFGKERERFTTWDDARAFLRA